MSLSIDIHILQSLPPSNVNRDDAGSPKTAIYGGARRLRASSQSWKRATRRRFESSPFLGDLPSGTRTTRLVEMITHALATDHGIDEPRAKELAVKALSPISLDKDKKNAEQNRTAYLMFVGRDQIASMAEAIAADPGAVEALSKGDAEKFLEDSLGSRHSIDVALFGRMVADLPKLKVDASVQVAHAIATHATETEFDYFTAVDDESTAEETGAGMIGTVEYASATLYRYANLNVDQLVKNLGTDLASAITAIRAFLDAFVKSVPGGHQNTFAQNTRPAVVTFVVRDNQPVNLVSAFEAPVVAGKEGLVSESAVRLAAELRQAADLWGDPFLSVASSYIPSLHEQVHDVFGESTALAEAIESVCGVVKERCGEVAA